MAAFIMAGRFQALGFAVLFALLGLFLPFIGLLSNAAIGLVTLRLGWRSGLQTVTAAGLVLVVLGLLIPANPVLPLVSTLTQWLLTLLLASMLQISSSWRQVLTTVLTVAMAGIMLFHLLVSDVEGFWKTLMQPLTELTVMQQQFPELDLAKAIDISAQFATGMATALLALGLILSLMIARHWQAILFNPGGFRQEVRELNMAKASGLFMVVLITVGLFSGFPLITDMVIAGMAVFLFQGIALVNSIHHKRNMHTGWLIGFYILLALMPVRFGLLLAIFGIIDSVADFRKYVTTNSQ